MGDGFRELDVLLAEFATSPRSRPASVVLGRTTLTSPRLSSGAAAAPVATTTPPATLSPNRPASAYAATTASPSPGYASSLSAPVSPVVGYDANGLAPTEARPARRSVQLPSSSVLAARSGGSGRMERATSSGGAASIRTSRGQTALSPRSPVSSTSATMTAPPRRYASPTSSPRKQNDEQMQQLLEQLDSELLQTLHVERSPMPRVPSDHPPGGKDNQAEVVLQILEDVRLLTQDHLDSVKKEDSADLQFLLASFTDSLTLLKLEVVTVSADQSGRPLSQIPAFVERMIESMLAHHRLVTKTILSSIASPQGGEIKMSIYPTQDCLSFPLERLWRTPSSDLLSLRTSSSFSTLVASAQQSLDRVSNQIAEVDRIDLTYLKADCRQVVMDLKYLHQRLLDQPLDTDEATTKVAMRLRRTQASMLDFIAVIFIRCMADLLRTSCIRSSTEKSSAGSAAFEEIVLRQRTSAARLQSVLASMKRAMRTLALVHAIVR